MFSNGKKIIGYTEIRILHMKPNQMTSGLYPYQVQYFPTYDYNATFPLQFSEVCSINTTLVR
jgi:hypothetical protein